jgi:hypothetical protein
VPAPGSFPQMGREARIQQLMDTQGLTREQAMANQQFSQMRGFDINNDGVVTNQEFAAARNAGLTATGAAGGGAFTGAGPMIGPNIQTTYSPLEQAISQGPLQARKPSWWRSRRSGGPRARDIRPN